jgi:uncharacterized protein YfaS (alpha-2-macroglobulin family)
VQREDAQPTLTLKPDKRFYRPGEAAKVLMATNVTNRPILVVAEGLDIWNYTVVPAGKRNFVWNIATRLDMSPNAMSARSVDEKRLDFRQHGSADSRSIRAC